MSEASYDPAAALGPRDGGAARPYAPLPPGSGSLEVALAAERALVRAPSADVVREVVRTVVTDLGGELVPARVAPAHALPLDVSLGGGEPVLVVVDPISVAALRLREVLPPLLDDARTVLARLAPARATSSSDSEQVPEPGDLHRCRAALASADAAAARALTRELLQRGVPPSSVVEQVLAPAQREVGERWYRGEWTVADEHAASAVTELCLAELPPAVDGPRVVLAAPEGEWHTLPGRMAAAAARGVRARALGPGLPAEHLQRYLELRGADLLAVSCTMATSLVAAAASIAAGHAAGVPVVAGGRAFGADAARAQRLGADGWAAAAGDLGGVVLVPRQDAVRVPHDAVVADAVPAEVLLLALDRQAEASAWVRGLDQRRRRQSLEDLRWIARHGAAALACDDDGVLDDLLRWLDPLLLARGVPATVLPDGAQFLADALEADAPAVAGVVRGAAARLR